MTVVLWFKRDLRVADHPALARAAELARASGAAVLPLYVAEPELWGQPDTSGRQWAWIAEALAELRQGLAAIGAPLIVRTGDVVEVLDRICLDHGLTHLVSHEETGNLWTYARDRRVGAWAKNAGVDWHELPQSPVVRRLGDRRRWPAHRKAFLEEPTVSTPARVAGIAGIETGRIPSAHDLGIEPDHCPGRQAGGREAGLAVLSSFLERRGETYQTAISSPISAEEGSSRLSPHLAYGTLSEREVAHAVAARRAEKPGGEWPKAITSFNRRFGARDFFIQQLEGNPLIETQAIHQATEALRPKEADPIRLAAWTTGETGLPFVDACMRYLAATGWINFRMRCMLVSVASYNLWLDWRQTGPVLARRFTDYEPGIHWNQMQMQSGSNGFNTPRIYNPIKQGHDQDPDGSFTRRWLPELADVPTAFIHEPWKHPEAARILGNRYPMPLVDVATTYRTARERTFALRAEAGAERAEIAAGFRTLLGATPEKAKLPARRRRGTARNG